MRFAGHAPPHVPVLFVRHSYIKTTKAMDFAAGDCVMTANGKAKVTSATMTPATKDDEASTIMLKGKSMLIAKGKSVLIAVGGVFTHPMTMALAEKKSIKTKKTFRGSAASLPALTGFQKDVVDVMNKLVVALVAKKTLAA